MARALQGMKGTQGRTRDSFSRAVFVGARWVPHINQLHGTAQARPVSHSRSVHH